MTKANHYRQDSIKRRTTAALYLVSTMKNNPAPVVTRGLALPPVRGWQLALYLDGCADGFRPAGLWADRWGGVRTLGADLLKVRLRLVAERLVPGARAAWGPV